MIGLVLLHDCAMSGQVLIWERICLVSSVGREYLIANSLMVL